MKNELGISTTLPAGAQYLEVLGHGADVLVTCPGPDHGLCLPFLRDARRVFLLRVPEFEDALPPSWHAAIPPEWESVSQDTARGFLPHVRVLHYAPATRLWPSIFAPLLARLTPLPPAPAGKGIWLPGPEHGLVVRELEVAARHLGLDARRVAQRPATPDLARALETERPGLFLSVNFHGLDPYGENQAVLEAAGVAVAVWCVDNPLHLLTGQKNRMWRRLPLFVTDDWFVGPLRALGADARHLPLATSAAFFGPSATCPSGSDAIFAGRSAFPDRDRFFAACRVPEDLAREADALSGRQAHFGWWRDRLPDVPLWPGNAVRTLGLGAERASAAWRRRCLEAVSVATELTIVGDDAWQPLVPRARLLPPVDYYAGLADAYRRASFTLNLTSLLLPRGLTQRHFDVWACGGFLLTDDTPGLAIFPPELAAPVAFGTPDQAVRLLHDLAAAPRRKEELRRAWQECILTEHTYEKRLQALLASLQA